VRRALLAVVVCVAAAAVPVARAATPDAPDAPGPLAAPDRSTEPVVLTGASFPTWAAPADVSVESPGTGGLQCLAGDDATCTHNRYVDPTATTGDALGTGVPVGRLLGYRWNVHAKKFTQIPFQVDEMAERYLANDTSGFAAYSETDPHLAYVWDEDRFRWTASDPNDPCHAVADAPTSTDPVAGLDTNDELAFMASDAGPAAPSDAPLPKGVVGAYRVAVADPRAPDGPGYVYVMLAGDGKGAPRPAYDATNGYVRYEPDADSDTFLFSQSSYSDYGNAAAGPWLDPTTGICHTDKTDWKRRRPKDSAWIRTPRYAFRYDGRWLMTQIRVAPSADSNSGDDWTYGPDLVDQWKARAFQQRPGGETPCCGYEEEVGNWGGSSTLMGWRGGPVRVIRATWGADSGTNVVRTEVFYRDEVRMRTDLRVHPIPPGDGIYAQWDFNAGRVTRYYNAYKPDGVAVDGKNDEAFGNEYVDLGDRFHNDVDVVDPTFSGPSPALSWEEASGPAGSFVSSFTVRTINLGAAHAVVTTPYYRDDSCFDDGTGTDPGVHLRVRQPDPPDPSRRCWTPADGIPAPGTTAFWQGSIGTFGIHILAIADSDNAFTTLPLTEIGAEQRIVLLPPTRDGAPVNVGDRYGRAFAEPLVALATPR
jgi:hypothetical protein